MKYSCLQESSSDCGFCALKVLLANLNNESNYLSLENKKQGSYSMLDIKKLALEYKLELEGYKVEDSSLLYTLTFPFICQIKRGKENHFVIVEKIKKGIFYVFDPSIGSLEINESIFLELFNQNVLTIKSQEKIKLSKEKKAINSKPETKPNETTKTETVTTKPQTTKPGKGTLPQTGKETPMVAIGVIVLLGGVLLTIKNKKISKNYIN